jgi:hypothetical protein
MIKTIFILASTFAIMMPGITSADTSIPSSNSSNSTIQNSNQTLDFSGFSNQTNPGHLTPVNMACVNQVENQADEINAGLNTSKIILLATSSESFESKLQGYNSTFNSVFDNWSYDKNCNVSMKTVNVVYSLYNATGYFVKNVVASEDPTSSQITNVTEQRPPQFIANPNWSGYEMYGSSTPHTDPISETNASWSVPYVFEPFSGACFLFPCNLSIWTGLSPSPEGNAFNDTAALVQTGTDSCLGDLPGQCSSGSIYAWYEFLDRINTQAVVCNNQVYPDDQVSVDVKNEQSNGQPTNKYDIHNVDTTADTMCTPIIGHIFNTDTPYYAQYINERPQIFGIEGNIPQFDDDVITGYITDKNNGLQSISVPYGKGLDDQYTVNNVNSQNLNFGGVSSGSFIQFWAPNCSTPGTGNSWTVQATCTLVNNYAAGANIEVNGGAILTVAPETNLNIDLTQNHIKVDSYGVLLVESGGKISKN